MSDESEGGSDTLLEGRAHLLQLRAQREKVEQRGKSETKRCRALEEATQLASFELVHTSMSRAEVRAFVTKKREQYAARYTAGEVEAPPLPVTRACKRSKTQATPRTKQPDQLDGIGEESPESPDDCRDPDYVLDAGDDIASADEDISADDEAACVSPPAEMLTCSTDKEARHYFGISESSDDEGQQPPTQSNLQLDQTERLHIEHPENPQGGQQETLHLDHPEKLQGVLPMNVQCL
ncbi:hypothetical protein GN958_ATG20092 [Phytophthora infestans]|uniref:Uncharacterized protein n=1 Tax=Phytophthora infestans TaxID=4787 RepID=A0A8S9TVV7_PHYIN|nr:hypothetical protein GN958_ATG20092 [Phytophthora infestans]